MNRVDCLGTDLSSAMPWFKALSSFGSAAAGGNDQAAAAAVQLEQQRRVREQEQARAQGSHTVLYVVLGLLGAGALGVGGYFLARGRR